MNKDKYKKLKKSGWEVGSVKDFLNLSEEEVRYIETKLLLSRYLKNKRKEMGYTQETLASKLGTSQPRVVKMEAGDKSVSIDLLLKAIFSLNTSEKDLAKVIIGSK